MLNQRQFQPNGKMDWKLYCISRKVDISIEEAVANL